MRQISGEFVLDIGFEALTRLRLGTSENAVTPDWGKVLRAFHTLRPECTGFSWDYRIPAPVKVAIDFSSRDIIAAMSW